MNYYRSDFDSWLYVCLCVCLWTNLVKIIASQLREMPSWNSPGAQLRLSLKICVFSYKNIEIDLALGASGDLDHTRRAVWSFLELLQHGYTAKLEKLFLDYETSPAGDYITTTFLIVGEVFL